MAASLAGRVIFITGASRGIGRAIALRCAADGARLVLAAKSAEPHPRLPGTIHSVAAEVREVGGEALPIALDVRDAAAIDAAVAQAAAHFGGIDAVINNAGAIKLTKVADTSPKEFDLVMGVNLRASFFTARAALPWLLKSANPHILSMSPPPSLNPKWYGGHIAYTLSKFGMSQFTLGLAEELKGQVAVNALWPRTTIATAAVEVNFSPAVLRGSRKPEIMADATHAILCRDARECSGRCFTDEEALAEAGVSDFSGYALHPGERLFTDLYIE